MDEARWEQIAELYHAASELDTARRKAYLSQCCEGDEELRREVESLLSQDVSTYGVLERVATHAGLPDVIGDYRILRLMGEGGMGIVYEAEQQKPLRTVALKIVRPGFTTAELLRRFEQESRALGRLQHPGIAQIYEAGVARTGFGRQPYFAMEFIRGLALLEYAKAHALDTRQRLELMTKICEAAGHAHERGVIHRDLKPANILVDATGQPKILDFGVARIIESDERATRYTEAGEVIGTLAYMSPEQVLGRPHEVDQRSDVYALGVILYELLAQRLPYEAGGQLPQAVRAIREDDPAPLGSIDRAYRGDLETIASKALEKEKARRYASAQELAADIGRYLRDEPILARPPSAIYHARKFARRHKTLVSTLLAVFLVLLAGIAVTTREAIRANRAERVSQAVSDFLRNDLLALASARAQANPENAPDPDLKVRTALDRAAASIAGRFGSEPEVEAAIRHTIGVAYRDLGLFAEAQPHIERAAELRRRVLGPENPDTLASMDELAELYRQQGKYAPAKTLLNSIVEVKRRRLGQDNPGTLSSMHDLALVIADGDGDYAQAEAILERILGTYQRTLGDENPATLSAMHDVAIQCLAQGKYSRGEELLRRAVDVKRRVLGTEHPDTISSLTNLAIAYRSEGKYAEAEPLFQQVLEARMRLLGPRHPSTLTTRNSLGRLYLAERRYAEAERLLDQVLSIALQDGNQPIALVALGDLAELHVRQRDFEKADAAYAELFEARRRTLGENHRETIVALALGGWARLEQGRYREAESMLRQASAVLDKTTPDWWFRYYTASMLGASLMGQHRYAEARPLVMSGYDGMLKRQDSIPVQNRDFLDAARAWAQKN